MTVEVVEAALRKLDHYDLVFGPTHHGGYYLIGMRGYHDVLNNVPMSTGRELLDITAKATHAGLSTAEVEATFDIDEVQDLEHLRRLVKTRTDLNATCAALQNLDLQNDGRLAMNKTDKGHPTTLEPAARPAVTAYMEEAV